MPFLLKHLFFFKKEINEVQVLLSRGSSFCSVYHFVINKFKERFKDTIMQPRKLLIYDLLHFKFTLEVLRSCYV